MADPHSLIVNVLNVCGVPIASARASVMVRRGSEVLASSAAGPVPCRIPLPPGFVQIDVEARAPHYFSEQGEVLYGVYDRWSGSNCDWRLAEDSGTVNLDVALGRVRFAQVVPLRGHQKVPRTYTPPGIVIDERPQYRFFWPDTTKNMMILRRPAAVPPNGAEWQRIAHEPVKVNLGDSGNWLFLEYGDPDHDGMDVRFLIGVWAPRSVQTRTPAVVVQVTPNPSADIGYPVDTFPFTGIYPYRMMPGAQAGTDPKELVPIENMHQRYPDLAIDRSLNQWFAVHQIYGARQDLFSGPNGPIVITIVPAATTKGVQRAPMSHRDGVGRLIGEILRFLWSRRLTLVNGSGRIRLLFPSTGPGGVVTVAPGRPVGPLEGFPARISSTLLTHSAGVGAVADIADPAGHFPREFPADLWGGGAGYGNRDWRGIWLMDGVARYHDTKLDRDIVMFQPAKGSAIVGRWKQWVRSGDRRLVAVYCEAGLPGSEENGLVEQVRRVAGSAGWIEEGQSPDRKISWLRMSNSVLAPTTPTAYPDVTPTFGGRRKPHDDIFMIGIGYAARPAP